MLEKRRIAVAVIAVAAVAGPVWLWHRDPVRRLVRGVPRDRRVVEARLTGGFSWAPLLSPSRSDAQPLTRFEMRLGDAVWSVLAATSDDASPHARHAAALGLLLERRLPAALEILEKLAAAPDAGADIWSDLAAARCEAARSGEDQALLAGCLAAADTALRLDDRLHEARFNRALALEQLGLRDSAREAWLAYAAVEADRSWADEARERARGLQPVVPFKTILETRWQTLAADPEAARQLARENPQDARRWGETMILRWWADALRANDRARADQALRIARVFGDEIERRSGEAMLKKAVAAIDAAGDRAREHLIEAHIAFRDGQQLLLADTGAKAQRLLHRAADEFDRGGSPLAFAARYYAAHTFHLLGDLPEARKRELELLASFPPDFHAYRGHLLWHLALGYHSDGEWGKAMETIRAGLAIFERLGEEDHVASMHGLLADAYERTGDPATAWKERLIQLRAIGRERTSRLQQTLGVIARGSMARKQWPAALSFLDLAGEVAGKIDRPLIEVETRVLQARVYAMAGRPDDATTAIASARAAAARIPDLAVREGARSDVAAAEAIIAPIPDQAITLLNDAIEYQRTRGRRIVLPDMLLRRGRAFEQIGDRKRAAADFEAGIAEVESHRRTLPAGEARWGIFNAAEELFEEAIDLALKEREPERAFRYAERARARELSEALGGAPVDVAGSIRGDVVLLEYVALPDRLVTFVLGNARVHAVEQALQRDVLAQEADAFTAAVREDAPDLRARGRALYGRLIAPIATHVEASDAIVVVAGSPLGAVPFAALTGPDDRFLIQRHAAISYAPSAAVFAQLSARARPIADDARLLIVADPVTSLERLPGSAREANRLAAMYRSSTKLTGAAATAEGFQREAAEAGVIHIATHGVVSAGSPGEAALALSGGYLGVSAIASTPLPGTAVVVLAACSTAAGAERYEGTISVARAFLEAGVPTAIATLWPVDDAESAQFFPLLHAHLEAAIPAAAAVRNAQLEAIERRLSPALWAAVACIGSGGVETRFSN
jgi:CHAT domain-containing protein